jgi:hypothetical protein
LGALGVLRKPFGLNDLRSAVMNAHRPRSSPPGPTGASPLT